MFLTLGLYLAVVVAAILLAYLHITRNFKYWKKLSVPFVKPVPLFGNVYEICKLQQSMSQFLWDLYKKTKSPYFGFFVFDQPFLLIRDLELIKQCLIKNFDYFDDRTLAENKEGDELGASILFLSRNPDWKVIRTKLTPVFATGKMKNMLYLIVDSTKDFINYLNTVAVSESETDAREVCMKFTTDVISSCAFGINAESFRHEKPAFREASRRIFDYNFSRKLQMTAYFFAPVLVKALRMTFIDRDAGKFMKNVFSKTMVKREKSNVTKGDLIDLLINIKNQSQENNKILDGNRLVAQAVQFFVAGFETTGSTISFTMYHLSLKPEIQNRLRSEIQHVLSKHENTISYEAIQDMTYLDMVVSETLRMYPVLAFLDRRCKVTHKLAGTDLTIEKGIPVYISLLGLHFDPDYFPNPDEYDPERFSFDNKKNRPSFCYMPFGEGPRNCIGARFGVMTTKVGLVNILRQFEVEPSKNTPIPLKLDPNGMLLSPEKTLYLHFKRITSN